MAARAAETTLEAAALEAKSNEILSQLRSGLQRHPVAGIELGVMSSVPTTEQLDQFSPHVAAVCLFTRRRDNPQSKMIMSLLSFAIRLSKVLVSPGFMIPRRFNDEDATRLAAVVKTSLTKKKATQAAVAEFINVNDPTPGNEDVEWLKAFFGKAVAIKTGAAVEQEATGEPVDQAAAINLNEISRMVYVMRKLIPLFEDRENPEQRILLGFLLSSSCTSITAVEDFMSKVVFAQAVEGTALV